MNILYISYDGMLDPVCRSQVVPYMTRLSAAGHKITLLSFEKKEKIKDGSLKLRYSSDLFKKTGVDWACLKYHSRPAIPATFFDILQGIITGLRLVLRKRVEIIHARGYISALIGLMLKLIFGFRLKLIFDMRGFWPEEKVDSGSWKKGGFTHVFMKRAEKSLLSKSDEIVVLTESAQSRLRAEYPDLTAAITFIPCCVDLMVFKTMPERVRGNSKILNKKIFIYSGSLGTFYNLDGLIEYFVFIKKALPDAFLLLITSYPRTLIRSAAQKHNLGNNDYRIDSMEHSDIPEAFSCADFSLIFYRRKLSAQGCCPIKFAESLACGVPVIMNSGIGDCDLIVENKGVGILLSDFTEQEYKKSLIKIKDFTDDEQFVRRRCRDAAREIFSLEKGLEKYKGIYAKYNHKI